MKKISPRVYASAFLASVEGKPSEQKERMENFIALVQRNGDWARRAHIVREIEHQWRLNQNRPLLTVESARPLTGDQKKLLKKNAGLEHADIEERENPDLIAGVKITVDGEMQLDASLSHLLRQVFA